MKVEVKAAIITAIITGSFGLCAAFVTGIFAHQSGEKETMAEINAEISNITGNNNQITINDISMLVAGYQNIKEQNQQLQQMNTQYYELIQEKDRQIKEYSEQEEALNQKLNGLLTDSPTITYQDRDLYISAEKIPINTLNSMIVIDGREYLSREIVDYLLPNQENLTIKSDGIYIGPVITESANLFNQWIMSGYLGEADTCTDSYGNQYTNVYKLWNDDTVTYSINQQYSQLRISIAIGRGYGSDDGIITIKADDEIVYTSPVLTYKTEPFTEVSIPINNCKLLSIEHRGGYSDDYCIISEAIVYN